ncbi:transglutaminase domain-containing protein [Chryseobacterium caseinilyticum]|uniref:DUF3857 domain-containing protein n=1 Tax=Chryseobacterium caseinilyticum TaxID=2771428 RepID=A0ABR8Z7M4_9FLAO|nr:transglutaminase domain-containing protein [Chryseobacterium caseinilyticum]MBD8081216.1 DUF3857 domain-containing protein [Chryseobacterium caseinilyticum]
MIKQLTSGLILCSNLYFSQHNFLEYPTISENEVTKSKSVIDQSAPAEILYNSVRYNIEGLSAEKTYFSKIKIFDRKRSERWLNIEIPVMTGEHLSAFVVNVYSYKNGKVGKVSYNKKEQLKENVVKGLRFYKMAIPDVADGDVIEYSYKLDTGIFNLSHYLEHDIPVVYQEYNLEYPDDIIYSFNSAGSIVKPLHHVSKTDNRLGKRYLIERFAFTDMKPVKEEKFVKNIDRFRKRIKPELQKYTFGNYSYEFARTWNKIAKNLDENDHFGGFLKSSVKDVLPEEIKKTISKTDRADKIFNYVKGNFKWTNDKGVITSQSLRQVVKTKSGNAAEINLLLVSLLRNAGIEANPLLISTVDNGILNIVLPNINNLNFVLASVKIDGQYYFYDATSPNSKANLLPERDWNDFGILFESDKGTDISFSNTNLSKKELLVKAKLDLESSHITGDFSHIENGMYAIESYDDYEYNPLKYNESFETDFNIRIKNVETKKTTDGEMHSKMTFTDNGNIDVVGSKIILNPLLFLKVQNHGFDQTDERMNSIDFISPCHHKKSIEIEIPAGYKVAEMPKPKTTRTDDDELSYKYTCEIVKDNIIRVTSEVKVASGTYPKEYYPFFKHVYKLISDTENQVISLTKK